MEKSLKATLNGCLGAHHQKLWMTFVKTYAIYKLIAVKTVLLRESAQSERKSTPRYGDMPFLDYN